MRKLAAVELSRTDISSFTLKAVALAGMACNHVANVFALEMPAPVTLVLYGLGGLTFSIMAFLITQGYAHTSDVRRYALRLGVFALVSQVPFTLLWGAEANVLFTLLIGLGILYAYEHMDSRGLFAVVLVAGLAISALCDWGIIGPLMILAFHLLRGSGRRGIAATMLLPFAAIGLPALATFASLLAGSGAAGGLAAASTAAATTASSGWTITGGLMSPPAFEQLGAFSVCIGEMGYGIVGVGFATLLLCGYRGRRGRSMKWFFYAFYPAHLLVIWLVYVAFF